MAEMTMQQAFELAARYHHAARLAEAEQIYRQILARQPNHADALYLLGVIARQTGRGSMAIDLIRRALALKPNSSEAHGSLGNALRENGQVDEAIAEYLQALSLNPNLAQIHYNLAIALQQKKQLDQAIVAFRQAIALRPNYAGAYSNLGLALRDKGEFREAVAAFRQAIALEPDLVEAHCNLGLALLLLGDFAQGWRECEWRLKDKDFPSTYQNGSARWDGSKLPGGAIVLHAEQGFGDTLHFARYIPLVTERCRQVIVTCQPELHRLLHESFSYAKFVAIGQPLPHADAHCPLLSLPLTIGMENPQAIPASAPYLHVEPKEIEHWRQRLAADAPGLKVGLAWAGRSGHKNDRNRSVPLSALAPLAQAAGISFYSLQLGPAADQAKAPPVGMKLLDYAADFHDFADTAALIANLDLIISVDTAVAHLAASIGKPVWMLLPYVPDWRWLLDRHDSPWYPTMRLFRQSTIGDWASVMQDVNEALRHTMAG